MQEPVSPIQITLPVRQLVEFLRRVGSIDNRFTGFDRANEGARIHRKLQRAAVKEHADYAAEVFLRGIFAYEEIEFTLEGRADGIFTAADGVTVVDEIKTTACPAADITPDFAPEHWAQAIVYAAIYAAQHELEEMRVQLTYFQVDEELILRFERHYTAQQLQEEVEALLAEYAPWARRAVEWKKARNSDLQAMQFPFPAYRPGQRAMAGEVYKVCRDGGQLLCQAPTGIGKSMSVLFPALKSMGNESVGPIFYLTARGTTRTAAENALAILRNTEPELHLRSVTLTAKDKICLCETRECTPEACPYANGYYARIKGALWDVLDVPCLTAETLQEYAERHMVCPFELGLDSSLWSDVIIGDYNYLFDPVVHLVRFFESAGDYIFLVDEAHNLPGRAREMHSAALTKTSFYEAKKLLGKGKSSLKNALTKVNDVFIEWHHRAEEETAARDGRFGKTFFLKERSEEFDHLLNRLCEPLEAWLDDHREPDETHTALLQLYFDVRAWLRVADTFDDHFVLQITASGSEVRAAQLCLDPSAFLADSFALGRAAVLFSATLAPASYYKDLCGVPEARAVALRSPFPAGNQGLFCIGNVSTRYKDRDASLAIVAESLATMVRARCGNYLAFFPSYAYMEQAYAQFKEHCPEINCIKQENAMDEQQKAAFLAQFVPGPSQTLLGFAVMGGVFGEGVDLTGDRLIGVGIVGPGLPQVGPRQEQLRDYFEQTRGSGFDYAYRYPGMNKVLQAAGRVIRTPRDKGVVLLIDSRFAMPDYRRLMPPHWSHLKMIYDTEKLERELGRFWEE